MPAADLLFQYLAYTEQAPPAPPLLAPSLYNAYTPVEIHINGKPFMASQGLAIETRPNGEIWMSVMIQRPRGRPPTMLVIGFTDRKPALIHNSKGWGRGSGLVVNISERTETEPVYRIGEEEPSGIVEIEKRVIIDLRVNQFYVGEMVRWIEGVASGRN